MDRLTKMKKMKTALRTIAFLILSTVSAQAINKVGTVGAPFLKLTVGARYVGMGDAYTCAVSDANAVFCNPAAMTGIEGYDATFSHRSWIAGITHQAAAVVRNVEGMGSFGLGAVMLGADDMEITTTAQQDGTGSYFTYRDIAVSFSYARRLTDKFSTGLTVKYIDQQIYTIHARGWAFDVGTYYWTGFRTLRFGMTIQNFGPDMTPGGSYFDTQVSGLIMEEKEFSYGEYPLPVKFTVGLAYDFRINEAIQTTLSVDALHPNDYTERAHVGVEGTYMEILALRGGYKINYEEEAFTAGFGLKYRNMVFDYAYSDVGVFKGTNTFSLGFSF
jgi:hypothetical protein